MKCCAVVIAVIKNIVNTCISEIGAALGSILGMKLDKKLGSRLGIELDIDLCSILGIELDKGLGVGQRSTVVDIQLRSKLVMVLGRELGSKL
jgi:hypothetical protein